MLDIFNVIQDHNSYEESAFDYCKSILECKNILKLEVNWVKYHHIFYIKRLNIVHICNLINNNINIEDIIQLNIKFDIINKLNLSYNQIMNCDNYTLYKLQDAYIKYIIDNIQNANYWFEYIIDLTLLQSKSNNELDYPQITILSNYLKSIDEKYNNDNRSINIDVFVNMYAKWVALYYIEEYYKLKLTLDEILLQINRISHINITLLTKSDQNKFKLILVNNLLILFDLFLKDVLTKDVKITSNIINTFKIIKDINPKYDLIILEFTTEWIKSISNSISDDNLYDRLSRIIPLIKNNITENIINYYMLIYDTSPTFFNYLILNLNTNVLKSNDINTEIMNILLLISLYEKKEELWAQYIKSLYNRIFIYIRLNNINVNMINFELSLFQILIDYKCAEFSETTNQLLNDINISIIDTINFQTCKYNIINKNNEQQYLNLSNISNVKFIMIDKSIHDLYKSLQLNTSENKLIADEMYPEDIKQYLLFYKVYYSKLYELSQIDYLIEQSIIDISFCKINIVCNIVQYTLIDYIINNQYTVTELINLIAHKKNCTINYNYLELYIKNLLILNIINITNNKLIISDKSIKLDISQLNILVKNNLITNPIIELKLEDKNSIEYLRYLILVKMFKHNSTKTFIFDNIINYFLIYIIDSGLNINLRNLFDIDKTELMRCIKYIMKRDIIEEINTNSFKYVV